MGLAPLRFPENTALWPDCACRAGWFSHRHFFDRFGDRESVLSNVMRSSPIDQAIGVGTSLSASVMSHVPLLRGEKIVHNEEEMINPDALKLVPTPKHLSSKERVFDGAFKAAEALKGKILVVKLGGSTLEHQRTVLQDIIWLRS